jgi:hypothetical protein
MKRIAKTNRIGLTVGKEYKIIDDKFNDEYYHTTDGFMLLKENLNHYFEPETKQKKDKVVTQVLNKFKERSKIGIKKYGTTLQENNTDDFLNHLQEELMDAILYLQKLKNDGNK